ncbi:response regulator [Alphaproteobacteria bacterium GH1-50]|uniref:Response regulator n=1 Tax=Kangsaoukella pontilimi TaxID=2691042 RepID=A0A7C9MHS9_9RHOB|nr:adenylate/guanylate cyclase domain-containing protein [Kangsaoukella pontilimi]MXQ09196.1 response regulator [Kangsaoukella pontilimi]
MSVHRILVVDDEPDVEHLLSQKFRREIRKGEMALAFARDGQEALDLLDEDPDFALVLSDINMPRMDGLTLLGHLAERHPDLKAVVVSAYGDMQNIRTAMNRGAFDFLTKPIDLADLQVTIDKTLRHLDETRALKRAKSEAELARATLARYFSPSVVEMVSGGGELPKGGERRQATFLFTDLAGFTNLVETTDPDTVVELLNAYFDGLARTIFQHGGTVMKVIGDAIHAMFGAPVEQPDHAARAVACALDIDRFAEAFRADWQGRGLPLGITRIGVNTGSAVIGNFGGESFFDYTAYGAAVNTAARLEAANKTLGTRIAVSRSVVDEVPEFTGRPAGLLRLAGHAEPVMTFEPQPPETAGSEAMAAYRAAFDDLAQGRPNARQSFAALIGTLPDDPLTLLHLQRALGGASDVLVDCTAK